MHSMFIYRDRHWVRVYNNGCSCQCWLILVVHHCRPRFVLWWKFSCDLWVGCRLWCGNGECEQCPTLGSSRMASRCIRTLGPSWTSWRPGLLNIMGNPSKCRPAMGIQFSSQSISQDWCTGSNNRDWCWRILFINLSTWHCFVLLYFSMQLKKVMWISGFVITWPTKNSRFSCFCATMVYVH